MPGELIFTSPSTSNVEISALPPPPAGGVPATVAQNKSPDIITATIPAASLYDIGSNPLIVSPLPRGSMFFVQNNKATSVRVVGTVSGDLGIIVPPGDYYLCAGRENANGSSVQYIGGGGSSRANASYIVANVQDYSTTPIGNGQDATAAFLAALASGVPVIYFPMGVYVISPTLISNVNTWIIGDGQGLTVLVAMIGAASILTFQGPLGQGPLGGAIKDLTFRFPGTVASSVAVRLWNLTNFWIDNVEADNCIRLVEGGDGVNVANDVFGLYLSKILGNTMAADATTCPIFLQGGAGCYIRDCSFAIPSVPLPTPVNNIATPAGSCGLKVTNRNWSTLIITDSIFYKFDRGIFLDAPTGTAIVDVWLTNALCDYCGAAGLDINAQINANIANVHVVNGWYVGWNDISINIRGAGLKQVCVFTNTRAWFSGKEAIHIGIIDTIKGLTMTGMEAFFSNRQGGGEATVVIEGGVKNFTFTGGVFNIDLGPFSPPGYAWTSPNAFDIGADCDNYVIADIAAYPVNAAFAGNGLFANTAGSKNRSIKNNAGANYQGARTWLEVSGAAAPLTTVTQTNRTPFTIKLYIAGILTALAENGADLGSYGVGDGRFLLLAPGDTVTPVFAGAMVFNPSALP